MNLNKNKLKLIVMALIISSSMSTVSFAAPPNTAPTSKIGEWKENSGGVWYQYPDGRIAYSTWIVDYDNGRKYHINETGFMDRDGWVLVDGSWNLFNHSGDIVTGWLNTPDGKWYYSNGDGNKTNGWIEVDKKSYFLNPEGVMQTGWLEENNNTYLLGDDGALITSKWVTDAETGNTYYLKSDGTVAKGTCKIEGKEYSFGWVDGVWQK